MLLALLRQLEVLLRLKVLLLRRQLKGLLWRPVKILLRMMLGWQKVGLVLKRPRECVLGLCRMVLAQMLLLARVVQRGASSVARVHLMPV